MYIYIYTKKRTKDKNRCPREQDSTYRRSGLSRAPVYLYMCLRACVCVCVCMYASVGVRVILYVCM